MDVFAGLVELIAKYYVGRKKWYGWLIHIIGGIMWIILTIFYQFGYTWMYTGWGMYIICVPSVFMNGVWVYYWRKDKK